MAKQAGLDPNALAKGLDGVKAIAAEQKKAAAEEILSKKKASQEGKIAL